MQTSSRADLLREPASKPLLLGLITAIVVGLISPLFLPHLVHPSTVYHIILHIASLTLAIFLGVVSVLAYARSSSSRLLFMTLGFIALAVVEFLYLLDAVLPGNTIHISTVGIELPHMILLVMLTMFFLGVVRVGK
jgi:hypothetical protein